MQNHEGWVKLHRKIAEWEWYTDANTFRVFMHIMLTANVHAKRWHGHEVPAGAIITSRENLAKTLMISEQSVRTSLTKLKSTSEITIKTTSQFTLIQLNNWGDYQSTNQQINQRATNEQPTSNHTLRSKKERIIHTPPVIKSFTDLITEMKSYTSDDPRWPEIDKKMRRMGYKPFIGGDSAFFKDDEWNVKGAGGWVPTNLCVRDNIEYKKL